VVATGLGCGCRQQQPKHTWCDTRVTYDHSQWLPRFE
jgi:hypothetical protein